MGGGESPCLPLGPKISPQHRPLTVDVVLQEPGSIVQTLPLRSQKDGVRYGRAVAPGHPTPYAGRIVAFTLLHGTRRGHQ